MRTHAILLLAAAALVAGQAKLGKPLTLRESIGIEKLTASPDKYVGKMVQVKGKAVSVCQEMGCWTELEDTDSGKRIRIKVEDGEIVFPKDIVGKTVVAEGQFAKISGKSGAYQIQGTGAVILD